MSGRRLRATLLVFALLLSAIAAPLSFAGQASSSSLTDVHAVIVGDNDQLVAVGQDGTTHEIGVKAAVTGRTVDLDDDTVLETPFVDSQGTLKLTEPDGNTTTLAESAAASKSAIGVGDLDGDGTPAVQARSSTSTATARRSRLVDGSGNIRLLATNGSTEKIPGVAASKSPISHANWTGDSARELRDDGAGDHGIQRHQSHGTRDPCEHLG